MRKLLWIGLFGSVAMLFGAADSAKADHCYGGGLGSYGLYSGGYRTYNVAPSFGVYRSYGYSPSYYSGYSAGFYTPSYYRGSGVSISIGRGGYYGGRGFYGGSRFGRGFGGGHHHHHHH